MSTSRLPVHFNVTLHSLKCDIISVASQDLLGNHHTRDHRSRFGPCEYERCYRLLRDTTRLQPALVTPSAHPNIE